MVVPSYLKVDNAYELSNVGNTDACLTDYTFSLYKSTQSEFKSTSAIYKFPAGYIIPANSSILLIPSATNLSADSSQALKISTTFNFGASDKAGFILRNSSQEVIDAFTVNGGVFASSLNVPSDIWNTTEDSLKLSSSSAGIIRLNANSSAVSGWMLADNNTRLTIGEYNGNLTVLYDNGCLGYKTPYNVKIDPTTIPLYNPGVCEVWIDGQNSMRTCSLGEEHVAVKLTNLGLNTLTDIPVKCTFYEDGVQQSSLTEIWHGTINQWDTVDFVFTGTFNFATSGSDRRISLQVEVQYSGDFDKTNDTVSTVVLSMDTPPQPEVSDVAVQYADAALLTAQSDYTVVWYENEQTDTELARGDYQTPHLYEDTVYYVSALKQQSKESLLSIDSSEVANKGENAYPSPFNSLVKNTKEQYFITAS